MKINYRILTIILSAILLITYAWHWEDIFSDKKNEIKMDTSSIKGTHKMPEREMMMNMTMTDMTGMMKGKTDKALEEAFITGMIPHHQGAVNMAKLLLQDKTVSPKLQKFAKDIIAAQESEIKMMSEWLKKY